MASPDQVLINKLAGQATTRLAVGADASDRMQEFDHEKLIMPDAYAQFQAPFDFVLISGVLETLELDAGEQLIAYLRDQIARELVLFVSKEANWPTVDLIALGLRQIPEISGSFSGYYFALETYKRVPDWLNSKFWANPENFNKYRW